MRVTRVVKEEKNLNITGITLLTPAELKSLTPEEKKFWFPCWLNSKIPTVIAEDGFSIKPVKETDKACIRPVILFDNLAETGLSVGDTFDVDHFIYNQFKVISDTKAFCTSKKTIGGYLLKGNKVYDKKANCTLMSLKEILDGVYKELCTE